MKFVRWGILSAGVFTILNLITCNVEAVFASVQSMGMGGAAIAYPLDSFSIAYNPAGIVEVGEPVDVEGVWFREEGSATIYNNTLPIEGVNDEFNAARTENFYWGNLGGVVNFCCNGWGFTLGVAAYNRDFLKTTYKEPLPIFGVTKAGFEYLHETISPAIAFCIGDCHEFGFSADYHVQRIRVNGLQNFDNIFLTINPGHVTNRGYGYAHGWGWTAGWKTWLTNCLTIGAVYSPKTKMRRFNHYSGFLAERGRLDIPERIGGGIAFRICPCLWASFDAERFEWEKVRSFHNSITEEVELPLMEEIQVMNQFGASDGPGFGFRNQIVYRVGVEYCCNEWWTWRVGYRHVRSPIRKSQTILNALTLNAVEQYVTVGTTFNIDFCNEFSVFYTYGFEKKIKGSGSIPEELGGGEANLKAKQQALGIAWGWLY